MHVLNLKLNLILKLAYKRIQAKAYRNTHQLNMAKTIIEIKTAFKITTYFMFQGYFS